MPKKSVYFLQNVAYLHNTLFKFEKMSELGINSKRNFKAQLLIILYILSYIHTFIKDNLY